MREMEFIENFKKTYCSSFDKSKLFNEIYPIPKEQYPRVVIVNKNEIGCIYFYFELDMNPNMVWVMYIKSYAKGNGSRILKLLCNEADKYGVILYLEPAAYPGSRLAYQDIVVWYRRHGFIGEATMQRAPNV